MIRSLVPCNPFYLEERTGCALCWRSAIPARPASGLCYPKPRGRSDGVGHFRQDLPAAGRAQATLEAVRALGLGCVQFNFECVGLPSMPEEVSSSTLAAVAAASRDTGVRLAALSGTFNMAHPEPAVRKAGLQRLGIVTEAAARLGVPLVTLCTGTRDRENMCWLTV